MLIRSQNKNIICNLDNVAGLRIVSQCDKAFEIHAESVNTEYTLGKYGTEERAKEVLDAIQLHHMKCGSIIKVDGEMFDDSKAYEMPEEAARIWLRVTDVRVERLQDITANDIRNEGLTSMCVHCGDMEIAQKEFALLWDSTIKKQDLDQYGWDANPWVWVIEFERYEKLEGE